MTCAPIDDRDLSPAPCVGDLSACGGCNCTTINTTDGSGDVVVLCHRLDAVPDCVTCATRPTRADRLAVALADYEDDTPTETTNPDPTTKEN